MMKMTMSAALSVLTLTAAAQTATEADSLRRDTLDSHQLDEVAIVAQRQLVTNEIDKLTYDVQADEDAKSKTTLDMLRKVPMVTVDGQDNIKVKGSSSFKIYRNGHRDPSLEGGRVADILKAIPASTIRKIEVITDPGAKEDAEGTSYILNIVMMSNTRFGGVAATLSANVNQKGQNQESVYVTTKTGKLTVSGYIGAVNVPHGSNKNINESDLTYRNGQRITTQRNQNIGPFFVPFGNIDLSYELDSLNLITVGAGGQLFGWANLDRWDINSSATMYAADGTRNYAYDMNLDVRDYDQNGVNARFDYQHKTHLDGETLTLSYLFNRSYNLQDFQSSIFNIAGTPPFAYSAYNSRQATRFAEHTVQLDYVRPMGQYNKVEVGAKYIDRSSKSDTQNTYEGDEASNVSSLFQSSTRVAGLYAQWVYARQKWSARAGLRYEYSRLAEKFLRGGGDDFHKDLNDWVPSASLLYSINDKNSLKLSFSTSINRPGIDYLNPTVSEGPTDIAFGNIHLRSSSNQSVSLDFRHVGQKLTYSISPYISWSNNLIGNVSYVQGDKFVNTFSDVMHSCDWGLTAYAQWAPWKDAQLSGNLFVHHNSLNNHSLGYELSHWAGTASLNFNQKIFWKMTLSAFGYLNFGRDVSNLYTLSPRYHGYNLSLQRSFLKDDRLTVSMGFNHFLEPSYTHHTSQVVQGDYTGTQCYAYQMPDFTLGVRLTIGKLRASVKKTDKTIENSDLMGGSGKSLTGN